MYSRDVEIDHVTVSRIQLTGDNIFGGSIFFLELILKELLKKFRIMTCEAMSWYIIHVGKDVNIPATMAWKFS